MNPRMRSVDRSIRQISFAAAELSQQRHGPIAAMTLRSTSCWPSRSPSVGCQAARSAEALDGRGIGLYAGVRFAVLAVAARQLPHNQIERGHDIQHVSTGA